MSSGVLYFDTTKYGAQYSIHYSYDSSTFTINNVKVKLTQLASVWWAFNLTVKINSKAIVSGSRDHFIDTFDWYDLGISGSASTTDSVTITLSGSAIHGVYQFNVASPTTQTVSTNNSGDSGGGGGWEEPTYYIVTFDEGGYTWDEFPSATTYYGYWNETINLSTPERYNTRVPAGSFKIVGKANGGKSDSEITATIDKKTIYTFDGWKAPNGYIYTGSYTIVDDATLIAQQGSSSTLIYENNKIGNLTKPTRSNEQKKYTITYNYDGGDLSKQSETSTAELSYSFNYWCSSASGTGTEYTDSSEFKKNDGDTVTVYAIWTTTVEKPAVINLPTTEKVGFKFRGWTTADQATLYEAGTSVEVTKDTEFIAVWETEGRIFIHDGTKWIPVI